MRKIRDLLMLFLALLTRHPRYHPEDKELSGRLNWTSKIWVANVFRAYEWLFGRGHGIRPESTIEANFVNGEFYVNYKFHTLESVVVHGEVLIRQYLASIPNWVKSFSTPSLSSFAPIPRPVYLTLSVLGLVLTINTNTNYLPLFGLAIAVDNTNTGSDNTGNATSLNVTKTNTGSNLFLASSTQCGGNTLTSKTYNSVAMTSVGEVEFGGGGPFAFLHYLVNPATGGNTLNAQQSAAANIGIAATSYTGVKQTDTIDATAVEARSAGGSASVVVNVGTQDSWVVASAGSPNGPSGFTSPATGRGQGSANLLGDSNAALSAGNYTIEFTSPSNVCIIATAFKTAAVASVANKRVVGYLM